MARRVFGASNTHLYPGARLTARSGGPLRRGAVMTIEFADLAVTTARVASAEAGRLVLEVDAHRTRAGAALPAKRWAIERIDDAGGEIVYRVRARLASPG